MDAHTCATGNAVAYDMTAAPRSEPYTICLTDIMPRTVPRRVARSIEPCPGLMEAPKRTFRGSFDVLMFVDMARLRGSGAFVYTTKTATPLGGAPTPSHTTVFIGLAAVILNNIARDECTPECYEGIAVAIVDGVRKLFNGAAPCIIYFEYSNSSERLHQARVIYMVLRLLDAANGDDFMLANAILCDPSNFWLLSHAIRHHKRFMHTYDYKGGAVLPQAMAELAARHGIRHAITWSQWVNKDLSRVMKTATTGEDSAYLAAWPAVRMCVSNAADVLSAFDYESPLPETSTDSIFRCIFMERMARRACRGYIIEGKPNLVAAVKYMQCTDDSTIGKLLQSDAARTLNLVYGVGVSVGNPWYTCKACSTDVMNPHVVLET